ncbi:nicotinate (nicotinamide) nucleotide adenylyltransferase [Candidatus Gottesmanbacteria bacterium]|nr:nicotinate (nicotinamide) nucleotide adenylyltransferase [Candidatus Gottesmanbacteria bacterium]
MDKTVSKKKIAIFGGSFDPPHLGHQRLLSQVLASGVVEEIWLMPAFVSPWKRQLAMAKDRLGMCKLLVGKGIKVSDLEIKRQGKSYTIDTVRELKKRFPDDKFYWLIGSDMVKDLNKWHKADQLFREIEFLVFPRTKTSSTDVRERVKRGLPISGLVQKEIEKYIKEGELYR